MSQEISFNLVAAIGVMDIEGSVTPSTWFTHIRKKGKEGRKAYLLAITILADIIDWYRPPKHSLAAGWSKMFPDDKLQVNYRSWAEQFGQTVEQVRDAVRFLKQQGYITVELRTIQTEEGYTINNVVFVEPVMAKIREITAEPQAEEA